MKKIVLIFLMTFSTITTINAQKWFTDFNVAKRLALLEDKMLLVMWESTLDYPYHVVLINERNTPIYVDMNQSNNLNDIIWEGFVPVLLPESSYEDLYNEAKKTRSIKYLDKLQDDSIKIMDANGNILNIESNNYQVQNLSLILRIYALDTSYMENELYNYLDEVNITTAFNLASKYLNFSVYAEQEVREEIIDLANIYFNESEQFLNESNINNKSGFLQRLDLVRIEQQLILDKSFKARRQLKRMDEDEVDLTNKSLYNFLNYTTFKLLKDEEKAALWKNKLSITDFKKANLIINNNL